MALNEQQELFLDALFGEAKGNITKALEIAGYAPGYRRLVEHLKEEILERATAVLTMNAAGAVLALGDAVSDENSCNPGISTRLAAAREILDRIGIVKQDKIALTSDTPIGLFILPAKESNNGNTDQSS